MMTLAEFVLARVADDEALVRALDVNRRISVVDPLWAAGRAVLSAVETLSDPKRVLAECAAKRSIVYLHVPSRSYADIQWSGGKLVLDNEACTVCVEHHADMDCTNEAWPCLTLRVLAEPYEDHPDYDEAWAV